MCVRGLWKRWYCLLKCSEGISLLCLLYLRFGNLRGLDCAKRASCVVQAIVERIPSSVLSLLQA